MNEPYLVFIGRNVINLNGNVSLDHGVGITYKSPPSILPNPTLEKKTTNGFHRGSDILKRASLIKPFTEMYD